MKLKKLTVITLIIILFVSQVIWINFNNYSYATENVGKFHYDQLDTEAKVIYDAMYNMYIQGILKTGTQDYDLVEHGFLTEDQVKEYENGNSKILSVMNAARYAFYADYPEIFYVNFQTLTIRTTKDSKNKYHAYIGSGRHANYYIAGFNNQEEVEKAVSDFERIVNQIVEKANNIEVGENQNKVAQQIKFVHNEIINNTGYRLESDCDEGNEGFLSTPYGALVKKQAVCEGYARAFKTILDKLGINCILVQGVHQSEDSAAVPHMWNYVEMEKETVARSTEKVWYAVDCTMDDPFLRDTTFNTADPDFIPGMDIQEGFENTRYCMVGTETMDREYVALETVEAAGNYTFKYPELNVEDYGIDYVTNSNGLLIKYKQEGTATEEYQAGDFYISYEGKGYEESIKEGKYILMKYHEYRPGDDIWRESKWAYFLPDVYMGGFVDYEDHVYVTVPNSEYVEFAVTTLAPGDYMSNPLYLAYQGDESDFIAQSGKLYNPSGTYKAAPFIKSQTPTSNTALAVGPTYHVDVTYDDDLVLADGATEFGYRIESTGPTGSTESKITNLTFDGKRRITFDLQFSKMFADDNALYRIYITGAVGKNSNKEPNYIFYGAANETACATRMNAAKSWNLFAKPILLENEDLSMNGWLTSDGKSVSDKLKARIALVTTRTTQAENDAINNLMEEQLSEQELITSETYNISLNVCRQNIVQTGHRLRLALGFPAGYGPEDSGVTFKAYHFIRDAKGNVTGVEEIPCVVTQYGLIVTCDAFSPFAIAVVENDGTAVQEKAVVVSATEGGVINGANREEGNIITLGENDSATLNVVPNEGYEIESITVCGNLINVSNKDSMEIRVNYSDVKDGNNIVNATFVAKEVIQKEEERQEIAIEPKAVPAEITMPESQTLTVGQTLKISPTVSETPGIQTYQWYKDDVKLEGETNKILEISNVTAEDTGSYVLKVTSTVETVSEEVSSTPCNVTVSEEPTFSTSITKSDDKVIYPGEEFSVDVNISNLNNIDKGLIALSGQLEYDANILEKIAIIEKDNWDLTGGFNDENLKFVTDSNEYVSKDSSIFTIKFKAKDTIENTTQTIIKVKNIVASNAISDIRSEDAEINVEINRRPDSFTTEKYKIENEFVTRIAPETTVSEFKENVTAYPDLVIKDKNGRNLNDNDVITTGMTLEVGETIRYTLVVTGDIDGNGEITITDLAQLKLHYIEKEILTGANLKAADMNYDGEITITDLAQLKLVLIEKIKIK